jgi:hypothetical protein
MKRRPKKQEPPDGFEIVRAVGLTLPEVEVTTKYDGSPVLKLNGCFMAGLATHPSAEPDTLVVRVGCEEREWRQGRLRRALRRALDGSGPFGAKLLSQEGMA